VQILGGIGDPAVDIHASQLTIRFARTVKATPRLLPAPGAVRAAENRRYFLNDRYVKEAMEMFSQVTLAVVGIGTVGPTAAESSSGVVFTEEELALPRKRGAVGDVCLRFYDEDGKPIVTNLDNWVIGATLDDMRGMKRSIGVVGGKRKVAAIRGALRGKWINGLITDRATAECLLRDG
jgi:DNA-binding transcriptional regulator LsrR (DeoR family)